MTKTAVHTSSSQPMEERRSSAAAPTAAGNVLLRVDVLLLPIMTVAYGLQFYDKVSGQDIRGGGEEGRRGAEGL